MKQAGIVIVAIAVLINLIGAVCQVWKYTDRKLDEWHRNYCRNFHERIETIYVKEVKGKQITGYRNYTGGITWRNQ